MSKINKLNPPAQFIDPFCKFKQVLISSAPVVRDMLDLLMQEVPRDFRIIKTTEVESTSSSAELLSSGRRHLAVEDYHAAVKALSIACDQLAEEHGVHADQCAEAYLWYGKALLGLSRQKTGVFGEGVSGTGNEDDDEDNEEENGENGEVKSRESNEASAEKNGEAAAAEKGEPAEKASGEPSKVEMNEPDSTTKDDEDSKAGGDSDQPGPSNGEAMDESGVNLDNEDDVDTLKAAWLKFDLARSILDKRAQDNGGTAARALLADAHLALGEVCFELQIYDKAVSMSQRCLEIQKELYRSDDMRIAKTHFQIGLASLLAANIHDAITHYKNLANILRSNLRSLQSNR